MVDVYLISHKEISDFVEIQLQEDLSSALISLHLMSHFAVWLTGISDETIDWTVPDVVCTFTGISDVETLNMMVPDDVRTVIGTSDVTDFVSYRVVPDVIIKQQTFI